MIIKNTHQRLLACHIEKAAVLIDSFAEKNAALWPSEYWPRGLFDRALAIGAIGSHGGTKYQVESYEPGRNVSFRFIQPKSYHGSHRFDLVEVDSKSTLLIHEVTFTASAYDRFLWRTLIQFVHNALIEDAFDSAEISLGTPPEKPNKWSTKVYFLRHLLGVTRLVTDSIKSVFKHNTKQKMALTNYQNLAISPICNVIIGFRNRTSHATRSKYVSFSLNKQPAMCQILLQLSARSLSSDTVNAWPENLFAVLLDYGLFKPMTHFSDRIKNFFRNPLNENRLSVITYKGTNYLITSFIFMAFNSQQPKQFIRETVVLPGWFIDFSKAVFQLFTQGLTLEFLHNLPPEIIQRLIKHGALIQKQDYPEIDSFFANKGQLSTSLCQLIPESNANYLFVVQAENDWVINVKVYFINDCPKEWQDRLYDFNWVLSTQPTIILEDSVTKVLSIYWLQEKQISELQLLLSGNLTPATLATETQKLFTSIYLIEGREKLSVRQKAWLEQITQAKQDLAEKKHFTFEHIIQPIYLALTRHYIRHLLDNKYLMLDKANGGAKKRYWQHRDNFTCFIHSQIVTIVNQIVTDPVKVGHNAITVYQPGAVLPKHKDDVAAFSWVMSIPIDTNPLREKENAWPIYVEVEADKRIDKALLAMGDGSLINPQMPHWRDELTDHSLSILFLWFIPASYRGYVNGHWIV